MTTNNMEIKHVCVAAVQMQSRLGFVRPNLEKAEQFAGQAAREGAQLIVLPELAACGYSLHPSLWDSAETCDGQTAHWLKETARRLGVYLGIGFVEAAGQDFFNTYLVGGPDGQIAGHIRKSMAEVYLFRCAMGNHVVQTEFGKFGVGICADNHFAPMARLMQDQSVDMMLMPHAWPAPYKTGGAVSQEDIDVQNAKARGWAPHYHRLLGVPAVFVNQVGERGTEKWVGIMGGMMDPSLFHLAGFSTIVDSDGTICGQMDDKTEGMLLANLTLDPARKVTARPESYGSYGGGWVDPGSSTRDLICGIDSTLGRFWYAMSVRRRKVASQISSHSR